MGNNSKRPAVKYDPVKKVYVARKTFVDDTGTRRNRVREFSKKSDAEEFITSVTLAVKDGRANREARARSETFEQYIHRWLEQNAKPRLKLSTFETYGWFIEKYALPTLAKIPIGKLTPDTFRALYASLTERGLNGSTVRHLHSILRGAFRPAVESGILPRSPFQGIVLPREEPGQKLAMTVEQARAFMDAIKGDPYEAFFLVALSTGMRAAELAGLKWVDFDEGDGTLTIRQTVYQSNSGAWFWTTPKTRNAYRSIPIPGWVVEALKRHRAAQDEQREKVGEQWRENGLIFPNALGDPITNQNMGQRRLKMLLRKAGLNERFSLRTFRRTFITLAIANKIDPKTVAALAGHSDVTVTLEIYTQVHEPMRTAVRDTLSSLLKPDEG